MTKFTVGVLAFALLVFTADSLMAQRGRGGEPWQREAEQHGWMLDYREAKEFAREQVMPLMVVFRCVP